MNKLKQIRRAIRPRLKQKELAEKSKVSMKMIQLVEKQKSGIEVKKAIRIAKVLKSDVTEIF